MPLEDASAAAGPPRVPVVCIGLSLGGLDPLKTIFTQLSTKTGMAFVVISHLSRTHPTALPYLLSLWSKMPAQLAQNGMVLKPNQIYVIPPGDELLMKDGYLLVRPRTKLRGWTDVITVFLKSLATPRSPASVAVILSGLDADGSAALEKFHNNGGVVIAQALESANHEEMPLAALASGCVDYILTPEAIPVKLEEISRTQGADDNHEAANVGY